MAVLGLVSELAMIPAEAVLSRGGRSRGRTLRMTGSAHTTSSRVIYTSGEGGNQVCKMCDFLTELFYFGGVCGVSNGRHRGG